MNLTPTAKKVLGILIIVIFAPVQILFFVFLIYILVTDEGPDTGQVAFSYVFVMAVFAFPLHYGFRLWRAGRAESLPAPQLTDSQRTVQFRTQLLFNDYLKLMFRLNVHKSCYSVCKRYWIGYAGGCIYEF